MDIYDTLIIGSGYTSAGYSASHPKTLICEECQAVDTSFYLPLSGFCHHPYAPRSGEGKKLLEIFESMSLFQGELQNTNGFEAALCTYLAEGDLPVLLKCRVVSLAVREDGIIDTTVQTNEGLTHIFARSIIDTRSEKGEKTITVLFVTEEIDLAREELSREFDGAIFESAFYRGRYALRFSAQGMDEKSVKLFIHKKWQTLTSDAKLLFIAPVFAFSGDGSLMADESYNNPIEAFEAGFFFEGGEN